MKDNRIWAYPLRYQQRSEIGKLQLLTPSQVQDTHGQGKLCLFAIIIFEIVSNSDL